MDNQSAAGHDSTNPNAPSPPSDIAQANNAKATQPASAQQLTDVEKQMSSFEKSTLRWARVAVLMSFLAAAFVCAQWYEMHTGGADTHALAVAAAAQAKKMADMTTAADKIRQAAENMATQEQRIVDSAHKSFEASNRQSKAALDASIRGSRLDQRAWVGVKAIEGIPQLDQPFLIRIYFTNTGKTPAKKVLLSCLISPLKQESELDFGKLAPDRTPVVIAPNDQTFCNLNPLSVPKVTQDILDLLSNKLTTLTLTVL